MEQIGFVGVNDKKDLLLNIAKILSKLNKSVLLVDATIMQRLRYIVPRVASTPTYVSEYDGVDVALGFMNLGQICQYLGTQTLNYDIVIIDTDNPQTFTSFALPNSRKIFYSTSYDEYELQRSLEILGVLRTPIELTKVIISSDLNNKHDEYLNHLLESFQVKWNSNIVQFPDSDRDRNANLSNQLIKQIDIRPYTNLYKECLEYLMSLMMEGIIEQSEIRKIIRRK